MHRAVVKRRRTARRCCIGDDPIPRASHEGEARSVWLVVQRTPNADAAGASEAGSDRAGAGLVSYDVPVFSLGLWVR